MGEFIRMIILVLFLVVEVGVVCVMVWLELVFFCKVWNIYGYFL